MGIKKVIAVACILVLGLGLAGYFVFSQTRIRTDLARKPENDSISMPNEAGTAHDESLSDTGASDAGGISVPGQDGVRKDEAKDMPVTVKAYSTEGLTATSSRWSWKTAPYAVSSSTMTSGRVSTITGLSRGTGYGSATGNGKGKTPSWKKSRRSSRP